jgi:3-polyprenyl-4-hydroxybenzoate decarboxylase
MKAKTFRTWLEYLQSTDRLAVIDKKVSLQYEAAAVAKTFDGKKAVYFTQVEDYPIPVVSGICSTREDFAEALETDNFGIIPKFTQAVASPLPCRLVDNGEASVKENIIRENIYLMIKKRNEGEAKNAIFAALANSFDIKHVVVVDDEVDIFNMEEVEWAIATRFQAERDLLVVHGAQGSKPDPSNNDGVGSKMGLDCTVPLNSGPMRYLRVRIPGCDKINLEEYVNSEATIRSVHLEGEKW